MPEKYNQKPFQGPISGFFRRWKMNHSEISVFLFSVFSLLFSVFFVQFIWVSSTAVLLYIYHIPFRWSPLILSEISVSTQYWTESRVYFIYSLVPFVMFVVGLVLSYFLSRSKAPGLKSRFLLTWIALSMVMSFLGGLIAGIFVFDGLGVVETYMFPSLLFRLIILIFPLFILLSIRFFWLRLFLFTSDSYEFIKSQDKRTRFFTIRTFYPLLLILAFTFFFGWILKRWYLTLIALSYLIVFYPGFYKQLVSFGKIKLKKSGTALPSPAVILTLILLMMLFIMLSLRIYINLINS